MFIKMEIAKGNFKLPAVVKSKLEQKNNDTPAEQLVASLFSVYQVNVIVKTKPFIDNILKYKAVIEDPTVCPTYGYVDRNGLYMTYGSKFVTNRKEILCILSKAIEQLPFSQFNIDTYIVKINGFKTVVFVDNQYRYLFYGGQVFDSNLDPVTFLISDLVIPNDYAKLSWNKAQCLTYLLQGSRNACKSMVVLGEPNCPACNDLYNATLPYIMSGELNIYWTLISFIDNTSRGRIFSIWDGKVPHKTFFPKTSLGAFVYNETFFTDDTGGIPPSENPSKCAIKAANLSEILWLKYLFGSAPIILFINTTGCPQYMIGVPAPITDLLGMIATKPKIGFKGNVICVCPRVCSE